MSTWWTLPKCLSISQRIHVFGASVLLRDRQVDTRRARRDSGAFAQAVGSNHTLIAVHSQLCADVSGMTIADGAQVNQWTCNGQANQPWAFEPITGAGSIDAGAPPPDAGGGGPQAIQGQWTGVVNLPSIPVAATVLPSGKVSTWVLWQPERLRRRGPAEPDLARRWFDPADVLSGWVDARHVVGARHVLSGYRAAVGRQGAGQRRWIRRGEHEHLHGWHRLLGRRRGDGLRSCRE